MAKNIMVAVTQQKTCDRLIRYGHELKEDIKGELYIIHVAHYEFKFLGNTEEGSNMVNMLKGRLSKKTEIIVIPS